MPPARACTLHLRLWFAAACALCALMLGARVAHAQDYFVDDSVADGLVLHYKFDEPGASTALPFLGPVSGVLQNGASMTYGPIPAPPPSGLRFFDVGVLLLDGSDDRVQVADSSSLNPATSFTVAAWVRRDTTGVYHAIYDSGEQANEWWVFIADGTAGKDNKLGFGERGVGEVFSTQPLTDTTDYYHIAVVKSGDTGNNITFYVDGVAAGTASVGAVTAPSGTKHIGGLQDGGAYAHFDGRIDDFRLYNRALSAIEVQRLAQGASCVTDGLSWNTAFRDLHCALAASTAGDDIWIGKGTFKPGTSRFISYLLKNGVDLFGGFTGTAGTQETSLSQRPAFDPNAPLTILSGDILGNDPATPFGAGALYTDNSNTMLSAGAGVSASLDSLRIYGGNANYGTGDGVRGGALRVGTGGAIHLSKLSLFGNQATDSGGAIFSRSPLTLAGSTLALNMAGIAGGAVAITSTLVISTSSLLSNTADFDGGAIDVTADATIDDSIFRNNRANSFNGGAINSGSLLTVRDSFFELNSAGFTGGAIAASSSASPFIVTNSDFVRNAVNSFYGGAIYSDRQLQLFSSDFLSNTGRFGGAIKVYGSLTVSGGRFQGNQALGANCLPSCSHGHGGALNAEVITVDLANFDNNRAKLNGGAIYATNGLTITRSNLNLNRAGAVGDLVNPGSGGGAWVEGTVRSDDVYFFQNMAGSLGGGLYVTGTVDLLGTTFMENTAMAGGGLFVVGGGLVSGTTFLLNDSQQFGGGIHVSEGLLTLKSATVQDNQSGEGGGVYASSPIDSTNQVGLRVLDSHFELNDADTGVGGGIRSGQITEVSATTFLSNTASNAGGAIYAAASMTVTRSSFLGNYSQLSGAIQANGPSGPPFFQTLHVSNSFFRANGALLLPGADDLREVASNTTLLHNTFADGVPGGSLPSVAGFQGQIDARNNIWANHDRSAYAGSDTTVTLDTNLLYNSPPSVGPGLTNTNPITSNPAFVNPSGGDYHIGLTSPARNSALNAGIPIDFEGDARPIGPAPDIGFDEARFVAPTAVAGGPYQGIEGTPIALDGSASSDDGPVVSWAWDCTNNGSFEVSSGSPTGSSCTFADNGAYTLRLRVTDSLGETGDGTTPVTVNNVTPVVSAAANQNVQVGVAASFALGSFGDPGPDAPWQVTVNWGDNSGVTNFDAASVGALPSQSHTYASAGNFAVTVSVRDKDGATGVDAFSVSVNSLPGDSFQYLPAVSR